jgi:hypothetical protein
VPSSPATSVVSSSSPPGGLRPDQVPQFIIIGSDDNFRPDGVNWLVETLFSGRTNPAGTGADGTFDGSPLTGTFFVSGAAEQNGRGLQRALRQAYDRGHEIANNAYRPQPNHTRDEWRETIGELNDWLTRPLEEGGVGLPESDIRGFRAPFLGYNTEMFEVLSDLEFAYDATISEGLHPAKNGRSDSWPYTLHAGSPEAEWVYDSGYSTTEPPGNVPGLWEVPISVLHVPTDLQGKYGLRLSGCDWNWINVYRVTAVDMTAILKYNLDLRLATNRAPINLCISSKNYGYHPDSDARDRAFVDTMRRIMTDVVDYALSKEDVRIVSAADVVQWMEDPVPLRK